MPPDHGSVERYPAMVVPQDPPLASSVAYHRSRELTFTRAHDLHGTGIYSAASKSQPDTRHGVTLDPQASETFCTCRDGEYGRRCWHGGHEARILATRDSDDQAIRRGGRRTG